MDQNNVKIGDRVVLSKEFLGTTSSQPGEVAGIGWQHLVTGFIVILDTPHPTLGWKAVSAMAGDFEPEV